MLLSKLAVRFVFCKQACDAFFLATLVSFFKPQKRRKAGSFFCDLRVNRNVIFKQTGCCLYLLQQPFREPEKWRNGENWDVFISFQRFFFLNVFVLCLLYSPLSYQKSWKKTWKSDVRVHFFVPTLAAFFPIASKNFKIWSNLEKIFFVLCLL